MNKLEATAGLRLLLFGLPGSGKSSLLGALVQAGSSQAAVLKGSLADDTGRLAELHASTYAGPPPATSDEVVAYPVQFVPAAGKGSVSAILLDCNGRLAQKHLAGKQTLDPHTSALARAMLEADTVIVTVDASAGGNQVESQLAAVREFLTRLEETRGRRAEVADLPVYLVLTKCDQLAKADDPFVKWMQRIEEAKRKLDGRFSSFLSARTGPAFGSIALNLWATAVRRPPLTDRAAQEKEPYGVAELFRQCLESAESFDDREQASGRRLEFAVGSVGLLVIMLALLAALFAITQPDTELQHLEEAVLAALPEPDSKADRRLRSPLADRLAKFDQLQQEPAFARLPAKTREALRQASDEMASYLQAVRDFQMRVKPPYKAKTEAEFNAFEEQAKDFALPPAYADEWAGTRLDRQLGEIRDEYARVRAAAAEKVQWTRARIEEGRKLDDQAYNELIPKLRKADKAAKDQLARPWFAAYTDYEGQPLYRFPGEDPIPGVPSFIYADLDKFQTVRQARKDWDRVRKSLDETHDLVVKQITD